LAEAPWPASPSEKKMRRERRMACEETFTLIAARAPHPHAHTHGVLPLLKLVADRHGVVPARVVAFHPFVVALVVAEPVLGGDELHMSFRRRGRVGSAPLALLLRCRSLLLHVVVVVVAAARTSLPARAGRGASQPAAGHQPFQSLPLFVRLHRGAAFRPSLRRPPQVDVVPRSPLLDLAVFSSSSPAHAIRRHPHLRRPRAFHDNTQRSSKRAARLCPCVARLRRARLRRCHCVRCHEGKACANRTDGLRGKLAGLQARGMAEQGPHNSLPS
jgi:hypothetical protein